jgi:hypothetical protein
MSFEESRSADAEKSPLPDSLSNLQVVSLCFAFFMAADSFAGLIAKRRQRSSTRGMEQIRKSRVALAVLMFASVLHATNPATASNTFKSSDGAFEFRYSDSLVLCQPHYEVRQADTSARAANTPSDDAESRFSGWSPDSCLTNLPVCPGVDVPATATGPLRLQPVVCIAYPNTAYHGTNFNGAAFSVSVIPRLSRQTDCFRDWIGSRKTHWGKVAGEKAKIGENGDAGMSHSLRSDVYQIFREGRCYVVEVRLAQTSAGVFDPGAIKIMTDVEEEEIHKQLLGILDSFHFLK